jgi:hypothetical protein
MAEAIPETPEFTPEYLCFHEDEEQYTCKGLGEALDRCWREGMLPYELGYAWAKEPVFIPVTK